MSALTETIIDLYQMSDADIAALESALFEQLRLSWLETMRRLAVQHGAVNPTPTLQGAELERLQAKAHDDAVSIATTYNRELRSQVNAIYERNPTGDRAYFIRLLASWGRDRSEYKALQIALATIMWAAQYGLTQFITRNRLEDQLFRSVHGTPVCIICIRIVAAGIVNYRFIQENPLPAHNGCYGEYVVIDATDLTQRGGVIWLGDAA